MVARHQELERLLSDAEIMSSPQKFKECAQEHARLQEVVAAYAELKRVQQEIAEAKAMLREDDREMRQLAQSELASLEPREEELLAQLRQSLLPKDPNDERNVIVEVRAGAGGNEAALFAGDLYRMYGRYAERQGWKVEVLSSSPTDIGGFKEIIFIIEGKGAFSQLKYESGVHRVQRVPVTESGGRIHTSTATVAVLPEAEEVDVEISPDELRIDIFCASGPGGQRVNTTYSAVRITHLPTGMVSSCQDEKSQHKNKDRAMKVLRARLLDLVQQQQQEEMSRTRRSQVGTGDRSERIRTYNHPQSRITDHRIGLTSHRWDAVLQGELDEFIEALRMAEQEEQMEEAVQ